MRYGCTCNVSFGVYGSWLDSEPKIWKRDWVPPSTFRSNAGAIASPRLGDLPLSQERTRSVTSSWYSIGGFSVSLPCCSGSTITEEPASPVSAPNVKPEPPFHDFCTAGSRQVAETSSHSVFSG